MHKAGDGKCQSFVHSKLINPNNLCYCYCCCCCCFHLPLHLLLLLWLLLVIRFGFILAAVGGEALHSLLMRLQGCLYES